MERPTSRSVPGPRPRSSRTAATRSASGSSARRCAARSCGASCSASPAPAPTWRRCAPRRSGARGGWWLTGQKVWTSLAQQADWGICLARTEPGREAARGHHLLPGRHEAATGSTSARCASSPARRCSTRSSSTTCSSPTTCVVGEVDGGWRLARTTLANERVAMAGLAARRSARAGGRAAGRGGDARSAVAGRPRGGAGRRVVKLLGTRSTLRSLAGQGPGPESSVAKLVGVRSRQDSAELVVDAARRPGVQRRRAGPRRRCTSC